ncbi:hypothetical protein Kisp01_72760 [Kineosporia sp. NBRC 101677]|nr:hypothetical protein Kisp01_72760 [Kineosporia sp. NBRC 101677]
MVFAPADAVDLCDAHQPGDLASPKVTAEVAAGSAQGVPAFAGAINAAVVAV